MIWNNLGIQKNRLQNLSFKTFKSFTFAHPLISLLVVLTCGLPSDFFSLKTVYYVEPFNTQHFNLIFKQFCILKLFIKAFLFIMINGIIGIVCS